MFDAAFKALQQYVLLALPVGADQVDAARPCDDHPARRRALQIPRLADSQWRAVGGRRPWPQRKHTPLSWVIWIASIASALASWSAASS